MTTTNNTTSTKTSIYAAFLSDQDTPEIGLTRGEQTVVNHAEYRIEFSETDRKTFDAGGKSCATLMEINTGTKVLKWVEVQARFGLRCWKYDSGAGSMIAVDRVFTGPNVTGLKTIVFSDGLPMEDGQQFFWNNGKRGARKSYPSFTRLMWDGKIADVTPTNAWERGVFAAGAAFVKGVYHFKALDTIEHVLWAVCDNPEQYAEVGGMGCVEAAYKVVVGAKALKFHFGTRTLPVVCTTPFQVMQAYKGLLNEALKGGNTAVLKKAVLEFADREIGETVTISTLKKDRENGVAKAGPTVVPTQSRSRNSD